jgi:hypothetical protein
MQKESCSQFESAILRHIAEATVDGALRAQLHNVQVTSRNYTGVGCYSDLVPAESAPATQEQHASRGPLHGPDFISACVKHGGIMFAASRFMFDAGTKLVSIPGL